MKIQRKPIDVQQLSQLFYYDNGFLYWKKNNKKAGTKRKEGYIVIQLNKTQYYAHRLIWTLLNGEIPNDKHIDHINRIKDDNSIDNLRLVTDRENSLNRKQRVSNTGIYGVSKDRDYYKVSFTVNNKSIHVGNFKNLNEARRCAELYVMNK